jgi:hypothetical protein
MAMDNWSDSSDEQRWRKPADTRKQAPPVEITGSHSAQRTPRR